MSLWRRQRNTYENRAEADLPLAADADDPAAHEAAVGRQKYAELVYRAGYKSARYWCEKDAKRYGLSGVALFGHCLARVSRAGWGRFELVASDLAGARADVRLAPSAFVLAQAGTCAATKICYLLSGWLDGVMGGVGERIKGAGGAALETLCCETQCAADGHSHCVFAVRPRAVGRADAAAGANRHAPTS